jgi:hypothetical protein
MAENDEMDPELAAMMAEHGVSAKVAAPAGTAPGEQTGETPAPIWPIGENRFWNSREQVKKRLRERTRAFIKPENALVVVRRLPGEGETTHCILKGDFVLGDLLPYLLEDGWVCPHMRVATLGMSVENGKTLAGLRRSGRVGRLTLVLSHYFEAVNKSTMYQDVMDALDGQAELVTMRSHAKVICCPRERPGESDWLVMEGSANLRSSDNLEQMTIFNDREVHDFHAEWIDFVLANPPAVHRKKPKVTTQTT